MSDTPDATEVLLDRERFQAMATFSHEALKQSATLNAEIIADILVARIEATVCAHNLAENQVRYPADWWEAFKERWFPRWAKDRWPVKHKTERIKIKALYPDLPPPKRGDHVLYAHKSVERPEAAA